MPRAVLAACGNRVEDAGRDQSNASGPMGVVRAPIPGGAVIGFLEAETRVRRRVDPTDVYSRRMTLPLSQKAAGLELRDFVRESLRQIIGGVVEAQHALAEGGLGGEISPTVKSEWTQSPVAYGESGMPIQSVEFDIAVIAGEKSDKTGSLGVGISVFKLGAGGKSESTNSNTSRISFSVPISLPPMAKSR